MSNKVIMLTGGSRSGKSTFGLEKINTYGKKAFVATAEAIDDEMQDRINKHKIERENDDFVTIEEPLNLVNAIEQAEKAEVDAVIVDCMTVWAGNLMHYKADEYPNYTEIDQFLIKIRETKLDVIIVTNELGMGLIPPTKMGRQYRDLAGRLNQRIATISDEVYLVVSSIPMKIKGN